MRQTLSTQSTTVFASSQCWRNEGSSEKLAAACMTNGTSFFPHKKTCQLYFSKAWWKRAHAATISNNFFFPFPGTLEAAPHESLFADSSIPRLLPEHKRFLTRNLLWLSLNNDADMKEWFRGFWVRPGFTSAKPPSLTLSLFSGLASPWAVFLWFSF